MQKYAKQKLNHRIYAFRNVDKLNQNYSKSSVIAEYAIPQKSAP